MINLHGRTCSVEGCTTNVGKFYKDESGGWICKKHYLKLYYIKKGKQQVKQRYKDDPEYRQKVLEHNKEYRKALPDEIKQEKRKQKYSKEKASGSIKEYREKNRDKIREMKRISRRVNAGKIAIGKAKHHIRNRDEIIRKLREYQESMQGRYTALNSGAKKRGIPQHITFNQYYALVSPDICDYCKGSILNEMGHKLDRKVSIGGEYHSDNCVPCCTACNMKKGASMSYAEAKIFLAPKPIEHRELKLKMFNSKLSLDIANQAINKLLQIPEIQILDRDMFEFMYDQTKICIQPLFMKYPMPEWLEENALIFRPNEILNSFEQVRSIITYRSGTILHKIGARSCKIASVDSTTATVFFSQNHLMAHRLAPTIGLYYGNDLVAALSYRLLYNKSFIEINRVAIKQDYLVVGGVSKLINHVAKNNPKLPTILSFVDCRYHTGVSLEAAGFTRIDIPHGWMWTDGETTFNRLSCRANLDERKLTEKEYAGERGWYRIYDAGQAKYIKENPYYQPELTSEIKKEEEMGEKGDNDDEIEVEGEPHQKYSIYHSNLRFQAYTKLKELAGKEGYEVVSTLEDYTKGDYQTREIFWRCKQGHISKKTVKRFTSFKCRECEQLQKQIECKRLDKSALSGTGLERKKKIYNRILDHCDSSNQTLVTTWEEFSLGKFSNTTSIHIKCRNGHIRATTWAVAQAFGCSCEKCREEKNVVSIFKGVEKSNRSNKDLKFNYKKEIRVGDPFGNLTIKEIITAKEVICECACRDSAIVVTTKDKLLRGLSKSCGCLKGSSNQEITIGEDSIASEIIDNRLRDLGYERLEGAVINEDSRIKLKCLSCQEVKIMAWRSVDNNCIVCVRKKATQNAYEKVAEIANIYGFTMVDTFPDYFKKCQEKETTRNSLVRIQTKCPQGHLYEITPSAAKIRKWKCRECTH